MQVSNRQLFFIIFITLSAFSIAELPKTMARAAGTGAWVPLLIVTIFMSFAVAIIIYLGNLFKGKTLFEYSTLLVGKFLTYCFTVIYIVYFFVVLSMLHRSGSEIIKLEILFKTPVWAIMFAMFVIATYAVSRGLSNIGRIFEFFGYIHILTIISFSLAMYFSGDTINIFPLFDIKEVNSYMEALPLAIMPFLGIEALTIIPLSKINGKKTIWTSVCSVFSVLVFYLLVVYLTYMLLGVEDTKNYKDVLFTGIRLLDIDMLQFLKRFDIIAFMIWIFIMFCSVIFLTYALSEYTHKILPKVNSTKLLIFVNVLVYITAQLPASYDKAAQIFTFITMYFGLVPVFVIPLILLIVAKVKKHA